MKNKLFWLALIVGTLALIGSCKKSDDTTATATTASCAGSGITETTCSTSASGTITGIAGDNSSVSLSGIFSPYHYYGHTGINGVDNATDCIDNATIISAYTSGSFGGYPTGTNSMIMNSAVTSSSTFAERRYFYSDSSCQTEIMHIITGYSDFTIVDNQSGLSASYSPTATKVTYKQTCMGLKGSTAAGVTWLKTWNTYIDPTVGTAYSCQVDGSTESAFVHTDNDSTFATVYSALAGESLNVVYWDDEATTDWTSNTNTFTTLP